MSYRKRPIEWIETKSGCWDCVSHYSGRGGYPYAWRDGKLRRISRYLYEECFGPIPKGLCVMHKCDNPSCINPEHLQLGTVADNNHDMVRKGRQVSGTNHGESKLSDEQVNEIRRSLLPRKQLAILYDIDPTYVQKLQTNQWRKKPTHSQSQLGDQA